MYLRKHLVDEMVEYFHKIKEESMAEEPNKRRIGRYKGLVLNILNDNYVIFPETILNNVLSAIEEGRDYLQCFEEDLRRYVNIIDKPKQAEVLPEYFNDIHKEVYQLTTQKIIDNEGRCNVVSCFLCPFTIRNLSHEFQQYYHENCINFGKNTKRNASDKQVVESLKEFLKISQK